MMGGTMMGAAVAAMLRRQADRLAAAALRRLGARIANGWAGYGDANSNQTEVRLRAPGIAARRRGSRTTLPDADLLWPRHTSGDQR